MIRLLWSALLAVVVFAPACTDEGGDGDDTDFGARRRVADALIPDAPDAEVDADFVRLCEGDETRPCGLDEGQCSRGIQRCNQGTWTTECEGEIGPADELCNALDDDCDGRADEAFAVGTRCKTRDERNQEVDGTLACDMETGLAIRLALPDCDTDADGDGFDICNDCDDDDRDNHPGNEERCDGRDNDCDELIDEPFQLGTLCYSGEGVCRRGGETVCAPRGLETMCDAVPDEPPGAGIELCGDGDDNDCDGATDEGFELEAPCTVGQGACAAEGSTRCSADGAELECDAEPDQPGEELCGTEADEDCDGATDEGFEVGGPCQAGAGACAREGTFICDEAGTGVICDAEVALADAERCGDGEDDDCDGAVDEGFGVGEICVAGVGACAREGVRVCNAAGDGADCTATPGPPGEERCGNDVDEDCDGATDEGFELGVACVNGVGACRRDSITECAPGGLDVRCAGEPGAPVQERCDALDNDCDGESDEGFPLGDICTNGVGNCAREGQRVCAADGAEAVCDARPAPPGVEICNGEDEDCDGSNDEDFDLGGPCDGPDPDRCERGTLACDPETLGVTCVDDVESPEVCNFLDDDCDGVVDNGIDLFSDPLNCGNCDIVCPGPGPECVDGACYNTYWVSAADGSNADGDGAFESPWRTLSFALAQVEGPRVRVYVRPGVYARDMHPEERQGFPMAWPDAVQVVGFGDRSEIIFDSDRRGGLFDLVNDPSPDNLVQGITIRDSGGGFVDGNEEVFNVDRSFLRVKDVVVEDSFAASTFVVMSASRSEVYIEDSLFVRNSGGAAVGVVAFNLGRAVIERSHFQDNEGGSDPTDGIVTTSSGELELRNCSFAGNQGAGLHVRDGGNAVVVHNSFADSTESGLALSAIGDVVVGNNVFANNERFGIEQGAAAEAPSVAAHNLFFENAMGLWSVAGQRRDLDAINQGVGVGNFVADPAFISLVAGNLRLREGSGAVDRADPDFALDVDQDGRDRPRGDVADVGAFESFFEP